MCSGALLNLLSKITILVTSIAIRRFSVERILTLISFLLKLFFITVHARLQIHIWGYRCSADVLRIGAYDTLLIRTFLLYVLLLNYYAVVIVIGGVRSLWLLVFMQLHNMHSGKERRLLLKQVLFFYQHNTYKG